MISKTHTLDGVKVVPGLRVWDYDMRPRIVGEIAYVTGNHSDDDLYNNDPWYEMYDPETGQRGSDMNCSRMWARDPWAGRADQ